MRTFKQFMENEQPNESDTRLNNLISFHKRISKSIIKFETSGFNMDTIATSVNDIIKQIGQELNAVQNFIYNRKDDLEAIKEHIRYMEKKAGEIEYIVKSHKSPAGQMMSNPDHEPHYTLKAWQQQQAGTYKNAPEQIKGTDERIAQWIIFLIKEINNNLKEIIELLQDTHMSQTHRRSQLSPAGFRTPEEHKNWVQTGKLP